MTKSNLLYELRSWAITFMATFALALSTFEFDVLNAIFSGDLSRPAMAALGIACLRSAVKAIMILIFPNLFKVDHTR